MVEFTILVDTESSPACSSFQFIYDRHGTLSFLDTIPLHAFISTFKRCQQMKHWHSGHKHLNHLSDPMVKIIGTDSCGGRLI